ncbi:MAG: hypothetical protein HOA04_07635 [Euryarchaeota archaeon]|jgi:hypothetical protein|nr:hypothetical protein [Euryarchaeota archaeon]
MKAKILVVVLLLFTSTLPIIDSSSAQSAAPEVNLECHSLKNGSDVRIEVHPGATLEGIAVCIVSNPTSQYREKISIDIQSGAIQSTGPSSITLDPNSEEEFQITLRAEPQMSQGSHVLRVNATVEEVNGADSPNDAETSYSLIINILQFAALNVEAVQPVAMIEAGSTYDLEYDLYNQGNQIDLFRLGIQARGGFDGENDSIPEDMESWRYQALLEMELSLPAVRMEVNDGTAQKFKVSVHAPVSNIHDEWPINSDGQHSISVEFTVRVSSEFSCRNGACVFMDVLQEVVFFQNQTIESEEKNELTTESMSKEMVLYAGVGGGGFILFILCFSLIRKKK